MAAQDDSVDLPLWWWGTQQAKLRLGGSFARALKRLDESAVDALQGSGDMLRNMLSPEPGLLSPEPDAAEPEPMSWHAAVMNAHRVEMETNENGPVELHMSMPRFGSRTPRLPGERPSRPPSGVTGRERDEHASERLDMDNEHVYKLTSASDDYVLKLLIIGDVGVGKTSLLSRFADDRFRESVGEQRKFGADFRAKTLLVGGRRVMLTVWDTAGEEQFRTLTSSYYRGCHGIYYALLDMTHNAMHDAMRHAPRAMRHAPCAMRHAPCAMRHAMPHASPRATAGALLVFDVTRRESFEGLPAWLAEVDHYASSSRVTRLLVGHKADAGEAGEAGARRAVSAEEAAAFAAARSMTYVEASAKSAAGVQEAFGGLVLQARTPVT